MQENEFKIIFEKYLKEIKLELSILQIKNFYLYMEELIEWNKRINLTAIINPEEIILKHFIDCLIIEKYIKKGNLIDIGTGAGFPGVPLKIYNNELNIVLLDSLNKRINFLNNLIVKLNLNNIKTIHGRAEDFGKNIEYREKFDIVTSRAVANLTLLCEYMLPFVKTGGICICMKGQVSDEIDDAKKQIEIIGGKIETIDSYMLPLTDMERSVIIIRKIKSTPNNYPRKPNQIKPKNL